MEKWWGFPAICLITPHLLTSVGPNSHSVCLQKASQRSLFWAPLVMVFVDQDLWTGVDEKRDTGDTSLDWNKSALIAEMHIYKSSYKVVLGS